jgi:FKBP-type peptidyl-prolyl cis-trans isomerase FkpA
MYGDLKIRCSYTYNNVEKGLRPLFMCLAPGFRNILILFFVLAFVSCREKHITSVPGSKPGKNEMADINKYLVQKDRERIRNYIERKNLNMIESPTGLWYQIINEGEGKTFGENDKVVLNYDCSLLDGTQCYSSRDLGPKEVVLGRSDIEPGLNEGLRLLRPGSEAIFIIPPFLAYGFVGDRKMIPSRAVIVYNVNILRTK